MATSYEIGLMPSLLAWLVAALVLGVGYASGAGDGHWFDVDGGACCVGTGCLSELTEEFCTDLVGGWFAGPGTLCPEPCRQGACCMPDGPCEDGTYEGHCLDVGGVWQGPDTDCETAPCPGACCHSDGTCSVLSEDACLASGGAAWVGGDAHCEAISCLGACCLNSLCVPTQSLDNCMSVDGEWGGPGMPCEADSCSTGACCFDDATCVPRETEDACESADGVWMGLFSGCDPSPCTCILGAVTFVSPPDGTLDARQPHPIDDATILQGWDTFVVDAPSMDLGCWSVSETGGGTNSVASADGTAGSFTIMLSHPIAPGELTELTYTTLRGYSQTGTFFFLPGDVDGSMEVERLDLTGLIGCLNAGHCDEWRTDINRSGATSAEDLLRLIDLFNGAQSFAPWEHETVPSTCPLE